MLYRSRHKDTLVCALYGSLVGIQVIVTLTVYILTYMHSFILCMYVNTVCTSYYSFSGV